MRTRITLGLLAALALSACSGLPPRSQEVDKDVARYQPYAGAPVREFSTLRGITGWNSLSDDKLVVWLGVNDAYLITVAQPCSNLEFTNNIAFTSSTSTVSTFDFVRLRDNERCAITEIRPLDEKRRKEDLRQQNAK